MKKLNSHTKVIISMLAEETTWWRKNHQKRHRAIIWCRNKGKKTSPASWLGTIIVGFFLSLAILKMLDKWVPMAGTYRRSVNFIVLLLYNSVDKARFYQYFPIFSPLRFCDFSQMTSRRFFPFAPRVTLFSINRETLNVFTFRAILIRIIIFWRVSFYSREKKRQDSVK